jgi:hypothetical protein
VTNTTTTTPTIPTDDTNHEKTFPFWGRIFVADAEVYRYSKRQCGAAVCGDAKQISFSDVSTDAAAVAASTAAFFVHGVDCEEMPIEKGDPSGTALIQSVKHRDHHDYTFQFDARDRTPVTATGTSHLE